MQADSENTISGEPLFKGMITQATIGGIPIPIIFAIAFLSGLAYFISGKLYYRLFRYLLAQDYCMKQIGIF